MDGRRDDVADDRYQHEDREPGARVI